METHVNLMSRRVQVVIDPSQQSIHGVALLLTQLGDRPELRQKSGQSHTGSGHQKDEWLKVGVAGFCFGNVMLFSFPEYLGGEDLGPAFSALFRWLNLILSLPVLL